MIHYLLHPECVYHWLRSCYPLLCIHFLCRILLSCVVNTVQHTYHYKCCFAGLDLCHRLDLSICLKNKPKYKYVQRVTFTCPAKIPHTPMMHRMLKTAEPTIVPTPTSPFVINTPRHKEESLQHSYK